MYVAFEADPQDYCRLSSSTACGLFRRGNCAYLPVSLFSANRCNDGISTSFGLRWVFLFFLSPFADVISLGYQLACFAAQSCIYIIFVWHELIVLFFFFSGSLHAWACALCFHCPALLNYYVLKTHWRQNPWLGRSECAWCFLSLRPKPVAQRGHRFMNKSRGFDILPPSFESRENTPSGAAQWI